MRLKEELTKEDIEDIYNLVTITCSISEPCVLLGRIKEIITEPNVEIDTNSEN